MYLGVENKAKSKNKVTKEIANAKKNIRSNFLLFETKGT